MKYGLIGGTLSHSFSAEIHNAFGYEYALLELPPTELSDFLKNRDFRAINVTVPYKETVIPYLDEMDDASKRIGAVNTIVNRGGKLFGYNTDYDGLCALIENCGVVLQGKNVLILGSGGTSKTAATVFERYGCASVVRVSRTGRDGCITYEEASESCADVHILFNATPCGMYPDVEETAVDLKAYPCLEFVIDAVYNPLRTKLLCDARRYGIPAAGGLYMLVAQAASAAERFGEQAVSQDRMAEIYHRLMVEKENIVLVGMPGCGKTTVGQRLAVMTNRPFIDTDAWIAEEMGCSVPAVFERIGEMGFRQVESEMIEKVATKQGCVIATGGGAVLRKENVERLRRNGRIFFLDRALDLLSATPDRPLSATPEDLCRLYDERYPIYVNICDVRVRADGTSEEVANAIREDFFHEDFGHKRT